MKAIPRVFERDDRRRRRQLGSSERSFRGFAHEQVPVRLSFGVSDHSIGLFKDEGTSIDLAIPYDRRLCIDVEIDN